MPCSVILFVINAGKRKRFASRGQYSVDLPISKSNVANWDKI
jgi:hypothetical protein